MTSHFFRSFSVCCLSAFLLLCSILHVAAQSKLSEITAVVVDENNAVLPFVQLSLKTWKDSVSITTVLADEKGSFMFEVPKGRYVLEGKLLGYTTFYSEPIDIAGTQHISLGVIQMRATSKRLTTVDVAAKAAFVERRVDRIIVSLNGMGAGAPIMDVMNQLPGVTVAPDDRISLNGKSVQIYIDGKATTLPAEALAGMLKGLSANNVQKVELIAQPSAKYDVAGNVAIINIIRKRNTKIGLNGNIYSGGGMGTFGKANAGGSVNYKRSFYNLLLTMDYNYNKYFFDTYIGSSFLDKNGAKTGASMSEIQSTRSNANYTPNLELNMFLSKKTTLSASVKPGFQLFDRDGAAQIKSDSQGNAEVRSQFVNKVDIRASNFASGLRLQHQVDTLGRELAVDLDYVHYKNNNNQDNLTTTFNPQADFASLVAQDRIFSIYALKADYTHPLKNKQQLEIGMKTSYMHSDNMNAYQDASTQQKDIFNYQESISALYLLYGATKNKISYQLGLRGEYTDGRGEQVEKTQAFNRKYFELLPSLHVDYKFSENSLSLGLNKRIERPNYESLNPLVRIISNANFQQGNPLLKPALSYNADLWYGYKNALFFGLTCSYTKADFTSLSVPLDQGGITTLPGNADYGRYMTIQAMYGKQVFPWWYTSTNATLSKRSFKGEINGLWLHSDGLASLSATSYNSFILSKNFSFMFLFNYRGKSMDRTVTNASFAYLTVGLRRQFLNKRAAVQLNCMDIFNSYKNEYQQNSGIVQQHWRNNFETRMIKLNLSYTFGTTIKKGQKSNGAEEEKKRGVLKED